MNSTYAQSASADRLAREKTVVFATMGAMTTVLYFGTLHVRLFAARVLAPTAVDAAIPFVPLFVVPYLSFFLLVLLPLWLISDRRELRDAAFGFGLIVVISSLAFLFWPTAIPYSDVHPLTRGVVAVDLDGNAFPSLHASLAHLLRAVRVAEAADAGSRDTACCCGRAWSWCRPS